MLKLHLGAGKRNFGDDWIHIDQADFPHIKSRDIKNLPYKNNEVDVIYNSHLIAYFDRAEIVVILNEWKRVLKPEGILRIATPDFESMVQLYLDGSIDLKDILGPLYGKMEGNRNFIYHKTTYDFDSLAELLREVGFKDVKHYDWWNIEHAEHDDHSMAHLCPKGDKENGTLISLNIECTK